MHDHDTYREGTLFAVLAVAGVAAALLHVHIPHTDVLIDGRWAFGFIGFALLRRWRAALALAALLSYPYGTPDIPVWVGFGGNMLYAVPALLTIRALAAWMLRRWGAGWRFGLGWVVLVLFCYQVFTTPAVWGVVAMVEDRPVPAGILDGWRTQPFLIESLLVALFSAATMVATLALGRLNAERRRLEDLTRSLSASEQTTHALLNATADAAFLIDDSGTIKAANEEMARRLGQDRQSMIGTNIYSLLPPETAARRREWVERVVRSGRPLTEEDERAGRVMHHSLYPVLDDAGDVTAVAVFARDITERRQAEAALRASEARFRSYVEHSPYGVFVADGRGRYVDVNPASERITGYSAEQLTTMSIPDLIPPESRETAAAHFRRLTETGEANTEVAFVRADGSTGRWTVAATRIGPDRFLGFVEDITERREREERIALLGGMLDDAPAAITIHDTDGHFLFSNRQNWLMHGYESEDEFLGINLHQLDVPESEARLAERIRHIAERGEARFEVEHYRRDGSTFPLGVLAKRIEWEGRPAILSIAADISERREAHAALQESEARFQKILSLVPDLITVQDADMNILYSNWNGFGCIPKEQRALNTKCYRTYRGYERVCPDCEALAALKSGEMIHREVQLPDGRWYELRIMPALKESGDAEAFVEWVRDITERKTVEAQLRQAQKMEAVGRLAGGVAHDYNNIVMGILNYAQLCRDGIVADHPIRPWLDEITREAQRSANLTRQLLAFARKQTVAPQAVDLNDAVGNMLKMLRRLIGEDIDLAWKPGAGLWAVHIDPGQVDQILANLCANARDAIKGAGKVTIETGNVAIDADYCAEHEGFKPGDFTTLSVSDDGCGMDRDTLDHIFEPFFTTKGIGEGTGLGLATVYGIARQNDGFVNVYSEPGQGTTFRIYLPRFEGGEHKHAEREKAAESLGGKEIILLVEDEKSIRLTMRLFLEKLGYTVLAAEDPKKAAELVRELAGSPDLLITDVVMPEMSGRELAESLTGDHPDMRVLYMSGYTANVIAHRGVLEDGVDFLSKPITHDQLADKVREILDRV
ncbi:PAS domain S-box protein [Kiritimatiella glycovorans]|uniref:histidine kinase n=1 Tax=Kiritimatiella glycovorans TaxID=1307763 RepID=A0A0G3EF03_9BACT|nr:PAS domain S-box protein [Kiritimatiella glycovorans]AKJ64908.1 PAS/PAC sensor hybrid histidine kinase [Kiritimatiella glycovorans]